MWQCLGEVCALQETRRGDVWRSDAEHFGAVHVVVDARAGQCVMPGVVLATIDHLPVHVSVSEAVSEAHD